MVINLNGGKIQQMTHLKNIWVLNTTSTEQPIGFKMKLFYIVHYYF